MSINAEIILELLVCSHEVEVLPGVVANRVYDVGNLLVLVGRGLQHALNELQLSCVSAVDRQASQSQEGAKLIGQTRQIICRTRVGNKAESALVEGHLGIDCHHGMAARRQKGGPRVEGVSRSCCDDWLVRLGDLRLQLVELLQVFGNSLIISFLLHGEHRSEIGTVRPMFSLVSCDIDGLRQTILIE